MTLPDGWQDAGSAVDGGWAERLALDRAVGFLTADKRNS